jgi:hypothetical protein
MKEFYWRNAYVNVEILNCNGTMLTAYQHDVNIYEFCLKNIGRVYLLKEYEVCVWE